MGARERPVLGGRALGHPAGDRPRGDAHALHRVAPLHARQADGFEDTGATVLLADLGLTGGAREAIIRDAFAAKGIALPTLLELTGANATADLARAAVAEPEGAGVPGLAPVALGCAVAAVALWLRRPRA